MFIESFWLIPLFPLVAALMVFVLRKGRSAYQAAVAIAGVIGSSVLALGALATNSADSSVVTRPWFATGDWIFALRLHLDAYSAVMAALVSVVATVVFAYAARYMAGEPRYARFFASLAGFVAAMLTLVLADDVLLFFAAWELVGLASYLLIGFWFERPGVGRAATQAFLVTRIGDVALLFGLLLLVHATASTSIGEILTWFSSDRGATPLLPIACVLLFVGAVGKSAQLPLHGWLPDAMAGPTPVSALIHSATMVAAGVYLTTRFWPLFEASGTLPMVAWTGAATAVYAAAAALAQTDLKRLLAYSTISQLGLMFVGLGAGNPPAALLLLAGQAMFKSLLFLGAGSIGHAIDSTDLREMGGLRQRMPLTFAASLLAALALAGFPVGIAWPVKDGVLSAAWNISPVLFATALLASLLTAMYAARFIRLAFSGKPRSARARSAHESPRLMLGAMSVLGVLLMVVMSANSPWLGSPYELLFSTHLPENAAATALALIVATAGFVAGWLGHLVPARVFGMTGWLRLRAAAHDGFLLPEFYKWIVLTTVTFSLYLRRVVEPRFDHAAYSLAAATVTFSLYLRRVVEAQFDNAAYRLAAAVRRTTRVVRGAEISFFDAMVAGLTRRTLALLDFSHWFDARQLDRSFDAAGERLVQFGERLRPLQSGRVYNYFTAIFVWTLSALVLSAVMVLISSRL